MAYNWMAFAGLAQLHLGSWEQGGRVVSPSDRGQPKLSGYHISGWPPPWLNSAALTRRVSQSREVSRSTPTFAISRARSAWTAIINNSHPSGPASSPFSKACARPESPRVMPPTRPLPRRDPSAADVSLLPPVGRGVTMGRTSRHDNAVRGAVEQVSAPVAGRKEGICTHIGHFMA